VWLLGQHRQSFTPIADSSAKESIFVGSLQFPPASGSVVGDDPLEHGRKGANGNPLTPLDGDSTGSLVFMSASNDALWVGHDRAVVQEDIHPVLGRQQRADIAPERKIWLARPLDRLHQLYVCSVSQFADLAADGFLPRRQRIDVAVDARISVVSRHRCIAARRGATVRQCGPSLTSSDCSKHSAVCEYRSSSPKPVPSRAGVPISKGFAGSSTIVCTAHASVEGRSRHEIY